MTTTASFKWKVFFKELYSKFFETDVLSASAQVAFYFSFAFFPLLLFLVTLFGMVLESTEELRTELYVYLSQLMPASAYELVRTTMDEIIESSSGSKLTLGLLVTLWSASGRFTGEAILSLVAGVVLLGIFAAVEFRRRQGGMMPLSLFRER